MSGGPPAPSPESRRGRWVAIVTGAISVLVGLLYLLMIVVLDSRGPLQPPPPEALGQAPAGMEPAPLSALRDAEAAGGPDAAGVRPPG
jgi:hypothetical protein